MSGDQSNTSYNDIQTKKLRRKPPPPLNDVINEPPIPYKLQIQQQHQLQGVQTQYHQQYNTFGSPDPQSSYASPHQQGFASQSPPYVSVQHSSAHQILPQSPPQRRSQIQDPRLHQRQWSNGSMQFSPPSISGASSSSMIGSPPEYGNTSFGSDRPQFGDASIKTPPAVPARPYKHRSFDVPSPTAAYSSGISGYRLNGPKDWHSMSAPLNPSQQAMNVPDILQDLSYIEDSYNEDQSYNSIDPRPIGPKVLADYDISSDSTNGASTSAPYPLRDVADAEYEILKDDYEFGGGNSSSAYNTPTHQSIQYQTTTPTKIPPLIDTGSLKKIQKPVPPPPPLALSKYGQNNELSTPLSPGTSFAGSRNARSPNRRSSYISNSSPTRTSPTNRNYINSVYSDRQYGTNSRSPSPKKSIKYERSPSLIYRDHPWGVRDPEVDEYGDSINENYSTNHRYSYDSNNGFYDVDDDDVLENEFYPIRDDSIKSSTTSNYQYFDDGISGETQGTENVFDYSILPELPTSANSESISQPSSPGKRTALHSALSFYNKNHHLVSSGSASPVSVDRKRLDFDLPPVPLDLPQLPFTSSLLKNQHFQSCSKIWSMSEILTWCLKLGAWSHDLFISKKEFKNTLSKLLVFHRSDIPLDVITRNVDHIMNVLLKEGGIDFKEEVDLEETKISNGETDVKPNQKAKNRRRVVFHSVYVSGVLTELLECYSYDKEHSRITNTEPTSDVLRCFSSRCYLNQVIEHQLLWKNTNINEIILAGDWATHWKLTAEDIGRFGKKIVESQSNIFDLLRLEQNFIQRAKCYVNVVGPEFIKVSILVMGGKSSNIISMNNFRDDVIKPGSELVQIHEKSLFEPLLKILVSEGKFVKSIVDIADLYYNWTQDVRPSFLKYISTLPMIDELFHKEQIKNWANNEVRNLPGVKELGVNGEILLKGTFNSRLFLLPLQLSEIRKLYEPEEQEYILLTRALEGVKKLASRVNEMKRHADTVFALKRINKQLLWKQSIPITNLNLGLDNRKLFFRGDLIRKGDLKITLSINHVILLDNFLLITEKVKSSSRNGYSAYRVIENPIAIELLLVEIKDVDLEVSEAVAKGTSDPNISSGITESSTSGMINNNNSGGEDPNEDSTYSFKIRYAGRGQKNAFIFSTKSERERILWISTLIRARSNLCKRLSRTEVFALKSIGKTSFAYELNNKVTKLQVCAPNDPIEPASEIAYQTFKKLNIRDIYSFNNAKYHLIFGKVTNMVSFNFKGNRFFLAGLSLGVYCTNVQLGWKKVINGPDITKLSVNTESNLVVILGNRNLRYYLLDVLIDIYFEKREKMTSVSLSNEPVTFFEMGIHRNITMLFYAKKKTNSTHTNFKVLIPETDNDGVFSSFKVAKKFYVQADCYGIALFNTSFAVFTNKGFEILELDKLLPRSIPEIPPSMEIGASKKHQNALSRSTTNGTTASNGSIGSSSSNNSSNYHPGIESIRRTVHSGSSVRPMGMYKLANNTEFLLVYNDCAIFTNKHGKLSRFQMLSFAFKAKRITFLKNYLFVCCEECLEIWSISDFTNGTNKLIQVIVGKDVSMINGEGEQIYVTMANPKVIGLQLVFQLEEKLGEITTT